MADEIMKTYVTVEKEKKGRESPQLVPRMKISIKHHTHWKRSSNYVDITFTDYASVIGKKQWVAIGITRKSIYFTFFEHCDNRNDRFKMVPIGKVCEYKVGDPLVVNLANKQYLHGYCSELAYPVYYIESMDTYCIKLEDSKRTPLFNTTINECEGKTKMFNRSFKMDVAKFDACVGALRPRRSYSKLARELGYSDGVITTARARGLMSYECADRLEKKVKIYKRDYELVEYKVDEKVDENEINKKVDKPVDDIKLSKIEFVIAPETEQKLYDVVNRAVYEAVKRALNE